MYLVVVPDCPKANVFFNRVRMVEVIQNKEVSSKIFGKVILGVVKA